MRSVLQSEDVLQSVALEALRDLPRFEDRGPGSLRAFLQRLVIRKIQDRARREGAQKRAGGVPLDEALAKELAVTEPKYLDPRYERLERALAQLSAEQREIVLLRRVEGLSSKEAAERLGKSDAAARQLFSRAMARLAVLAATDEPR